MSGKNYARPHEDHSVQQLLVTAVAVATSKTGMDRTEKAITSTDQLITKKDRKMLSIYAQVKEKHLIENVVPYCCLVQQGHVPHFERGSKRGLQ